MNRHARLASTIAAKSPSRFRLGAVLVKRNRVLSVGWNNMSKSHPLQQKYCDHDHALGLHAEVHSCLGVSLPELNGANMYVARVLRDGTLALAKPCRVCQRFLISVGIRKVTYTTDEGLESLSL